MGEGDRPSSTVLPHCFKNKEKPLTLPRVWEANRPGLSLSPVAKSPKVKKLSHHQQLCQPASLSTWHGSVVGEKKSLKSCSSQLQISRPRLWPRRKMQRSMVQAWEGSGPGKLTKSSGGFLKQTGPGSFYSLPFLKGE